MERHSSDNHRLLTMILRYAVSLNCTEICGRRSSLKKNIYVRFLLAKNSPWSDRNRLLFSREFDMTKKLGYSKVCVNQRVNAAMRQLLHAICSHIEICHVSEFLEFIKTDYLFVVEFFSLLFVDRFKWNPFNMPKELRFGSARPQSLY